ncbi:hypothetical protein AVEN_115431-1 [Araneus ventricosus]|uniref:Uncharacterized protein n=1 Tax=Araneus ventricosus TaxID=182803 RepID=A0A4Y2Q2G8_ARAVE|nr:hypothetical protein AVEN_115431-1 [Araneus ventricosus]
MEASKRAAQVSSSSIKMIILFKWISKYLLSQQLAHPGPRRWPGVKVSVLGPDVLSSKPTVTKDSTYIYVALIHAKYGVEDQMSCRWCGIEASRRVAQLPSSSIKITRSMPEKSACGLKTRD